MPTTKKQKAVTALNEALHQSDKNYQRPQMQTYMTAPEWRNVDMASEFAHFSEEKKPFYLFPYFSQTFLFWKILINSVKAAHQEGTPGKEILLSEFFMMDVFIGAFTTVEYLAKGILSLPAKALAYITGHKENKSDTQKKFTEFFKQYAEFIHHTPFYDYQYTHWVPILWSTFYHSSNKTLDDFFSLLYYSIELPLKGLVATPVAWIYNSEANQAHETIDVLLSYKKTQGDETRNTKDITEKLTHAFDDIKVKHAKAPLSSSNVLPPLSSFMKSRYSFIKTTLPRYEPLMTSLKCLHQEGFTVEKVAGQEKIQLKCQIRTKEKNTQILSPTLSKAFKNASVLYHYSNSVDPTLRFVMLEVATNQLNDVMVQIEANEATDLLLIHDF